MAEMDKTSPGFEIPQQQDQIEQDTGQVEHVESQKAVVETVGTAQENSKQPPQILPQVPAQDVPADDQQAQITPIPVVDDSLGVQKLPAKDGDLIEKEWVERAKSIISKTTDDPHQQKSQVSKMKAAYIQKRFNKAVKTDEATV